MFQVRPSALTFIKKEMPTQVFSNEYCKISKNNFFIEHLQWMLLKYQVPNHCRVNETYTLTIRHRKVTVLLLQSGKNLILKFHDHNFLARVRFLRHHFLGCHICLFQVEYFSCAIFVRWHYFQITLKSAIFVGCI